MSTVFAPALLSLLLAAAPDEKKDDPVETELKALRDALKLAFNKRDLEGMLKHIHKDVVIVWQNGEVVQGHDQFRAYYKKMMADDDRLVETATADPKVEGRSVILSSQNSTVAVSFGKMNDHFKLRDGMEFDLDSEWSATVIKYDGHWLVASFHPSVNPFENAILKKAIRKTALFAGGGGLLGGLLLGIGGMWLVGRRRKAPAA